jgi:hypothetical protein
MIEVRVRLWTNNIGKGGKIIPKHAWGSGTVRLESNPSHGILAGKGMTFHSLLEIPEKIEKVLIREGVRIHVPPKMAKYIT